MPIAAFTFSHIASPMTSWIAGGVASNSAMVIVPAAASHNAEPHDKNLRLLMVNHHCCRRRFPVQAKKREMSGLGELPGLMTTMT